jgi:hypothetical protein
VRIEARDATRCQQSNHLLAGQEAVGDEVANDPRKRGV